MALADVQLVYFTQWALEKVLHSIYALYLQNQVILGGQEPIQGQSLNI